MTTASASAVPPRPAAWLSGNGVWLLAALLAAANLVPLFAVPDPPLQDYPSHLLRAHLFFEYENPRLGYAAHYTRSWLPGPYVLADGLTVAFAQVLPLRLAGKLVLALTVTLVPLAVVALLGAIRPDKRLLGLAAFPAAYHWPFHMGFVSYSLSLAPALFALALWFRRRAAWRPRDTAGLAALALLCYLGHLFSFAILALLLVAAALLEPRRWRLLAQVLAALAPAALLLAAVNAVEGAAGTGQPLLLVYGPLRAKLADAAGVLLALAPAAEARLFAALGLLLAPFVALGLARAESRRPLALALVAAALYLVLPDHVGGGDFLIGYVAIRVPLVFGALLLAVADAPRSTWGRGVLGAILVGFALVRGGQLTSIYRRVEVDLASYRAALARLPADARPRFEIERGPARRGSVGPETLFGNYFFLRSSVSRIPRLEAFVGPLRPIAYRRPEPRLRPDAQAAGVPPIFVRSAVARAQALLALGGERSPHFARGAAAAGFAPRCTLGPAQWLVRVRASSIARTQASYFQHGFDAGHDHLVVLRRRAGLALRPRVGFVELFASGRAHVLRRAATPPP